MSGKDIMEALDGVSDKKLMAAMGVYEKKQRSRGILFRVAAMAATLAIILTAALWPEKTEEPGIISVPGVMKVYACDSEQIEEGDALEKHEITSSPGYCAVIAIPTVSAGWKTPFTFQIPEDYYGDAEITFDVTCEYKAFCGGIVINNGESIVFDSHKVSPAVFDIRKELEEEGKFYLETIIRADGNIVGYGMITFGFDDRACMAYKVETVCYPLVDGEYQDVTEEYVLTQIAEYKQLHKDDEVPNYFSEANNRQNKVS